MGFFPPSFFSLLHFGFVTLFSFPFGPQRSAHFLLPKSFTSSCTWIQSVFPTFASSRHNALQIDRRYPLFSRSGWFHLCVARRHPSGARSPASRIPTPRVSGTPNQPIVCLLMTSIHYSYAQYQISDTPAGNAQAEAEAVFVELFEGIELATVSDQDRDNVEAMRKQAEDAETDLFNPAIDAASGAEGASFPLPRPMWL